MGGSMGVTQGMLDEFGPERVRNAPISEMAIVGAGDRRRDAGDASGHRDHVRGLPHARDGADRQPGGEAPLDVGRPAEGSADGADAGRRGVVARRAACAAGRGLVRPRPRAEGRLRRRRPADVRGLLWSAIYDDNPVVFFEHRTLYGIKEEVPEELEPIPIGKARVHREGTDVTVVATGRLVHESLKAAEEAESRGHLGRGRRPAHAAAAGRGGDRVVGARRRPAASSPTRRSRGWASAPRLPGRPARRLRLPRRADRARRREVRARSRSRR